MNTDYDEDIFRSLRRIIRAIDLHSRQISGRYQLTMPQLVCLRQLGELGFSTAGQLAQAVYLSQATVTGILDRLEKRGLVERTRGQADRRKVGLNLTDKGREVYDTAPEPLQDRFSARFALLPPEEQEEIDRVLKKVVDMMEAGDIDAWPVVTTEQLI